jgi:hypothetical protein
MQIEQGQSWRLNAVQFKLVALVLGNDQKLAVIKKILALSPRPVRIPRITRNHMDSPMMKTLFNGRSEVALETRPGNLTMSARPATAKTISRRDLLKQTAAGVAAGTLAATLGQVLAAETTPSALQTGPLPTPTAPKPSGKIPSP